MNPEVDAPPLHPGVEELRADDLGLDMEVWNGLPPEDYKEHWRLAPRERHPRQT